MQIPFNSSERASLGVEWELMLVDRRTRELSAGAVEILAELTPDGATEPAKAKHELLQSTIEIITGICTTVEEAKGDLAGTLAQVSAAAERRGRPPRWGRSGGRRSRRSRPEGSGGQQVGRGAGGARARPAEDRQRA